MAEPILSTAADSTAADPRSPGPPWRLGVAIGLAGFVTAVAILPLDNNDIWIHLTTGELILSEGSVPTTDRYSFTAAGNRYVAHEWLAAVLYAVGERAGGSPGVVVSAKLLPAAALLGVLWLAIGAVRAPPEIALAVPLLALTVVHRRIAARPELLALVLLMAVLWLLWRDREAACAGRRTRALYLLVPIEAVWVNVHGSFPLGIVLAGLFAMAEAASNGIQMRDVRGDAIRFAGFGLGLAGVGWLGSLEPAAFGVGAACALAVAVTLYTLDGFSPVFRRVPPVPRQGVLRLAGVAVLMGAAVLINPIG